MTGHETKDDRKAFCVNRPPTHEARGKFPDKVHALWYRTCVILGIHSELQGTIHAWGIARTEEAEGSKKPRLSTLKLGQHFSIVTKQL